MVTLVRRAFAAPCAAFALAAASSVTPGRRPPRPRRWRQRSAAPWERRPAANPSAAAAIFGALPGHIGGGRNGIVAIRRGCRFDRQSGATTAATGAGAGGAGGGTPGSTASSVSAGRLDRAPCPCRPPGPRSLGAASLLAAASVLAAASLLIASASRAFVRRPRRSAPRWSVPSLVGSVSPSVGLDAASTCRTRCRPPRRLCWHLSARLRSDPAGGARAAKRRSPRPGARRRPKAGRGGRYSRRGCAPRDGDDGQRRRC